MQQSTWNPSKCRICGWFASWKWWIFQEGSTGCSMHFCSCLEVLNCLTPANLGIDTVLNPLPVVPARGGAEIVLGIYSKTFLIELACAVRQPGPCVRMRACFVRSCCNVVVQEHDLRTTPAQCNAKQTLSSHFTLHSSHFTLALRTRHFVSSQIMWALLTSSQLFSPHPALLTCYLSKFSTVFISSEH